MERIVTVGESAELVLGQEVLQQIGAGVGDQVEIKLTGRLLIVRSVAEAVTGEKENPTLENTKATVSKTTDEKGKKTVAEMMESIMDRHDNLFRRLAEGVK